MPRELVYLATPYSHPDPTIMEQRFRVANMAAARLMEAGVFVFSPISHTHPIAVAGELPKGWDFWKAYDTTVISSCRKLIVLMQDGWKESTGVAAEIRIALELGIPVEPMHVPDDWTADKPN